MENLYIPVILGTARSGRESEKVAVFVLKQIESFGLKSEIIDVKDYLAGKTISAWEENETTKPWKDMAQKADGFIVIVPEYNHGYPGELKIALDMAYKEYCKKPIAVCGVSSGCLGGARAVDNLRQVLVGLDMIPVSFAMYFSNVAHAFNEKGEPKDESTKENTNKMIEELLSYAKALKNN